ncbi:hypothetical protein Syun_005085 [Stephania yunnanensis]|uniref:J domain-containing protein n=1 Tax=Stephania yunnanensis TaxID=152371 RepID=A0AAP0Q1W6_9MAGN
MADLSRSRPPLQPSATTALSKKAFAASKNVYQDVFGGPPKFGLPNLSSRIDDYAEIFGGYHASRGSSIPFLDLPDVDESAFLTSKLDYSEVFGGSGRVDFAVPYEELFAEPAGVDGVDGVESSSEDVCPENLGLVPGLSVIDIYLLCLSILKSVPFRWNIILLLLNVKLYKIVVIRYSLSCSTFYAFLLGIYQTPAETGSPSEGSSEDPSCFENVQAFSNGKSHHPSYESVQQINTFYHKSKLRSTEDGISGTTHVAELNAVPAYTLVVDNDDIPTQKEKNGKSLHQVANECNLNLDSFIELTDGKLFSDKSSCQAAADTVSRAPENVPRTQRSPDMNGTSSEKSFLTVTEINLRTRPSQVPPPARPPPKLAIKQGESKRPEASNLSKNYSFEGAIKNGSPVFYDVEVDASSSAAASAAAMKEAMEKAQATLKSAKVSMERKREGLHNRKKSGLKENFIVKEKVESEIAQELYKTEEDNSYYRKFRKDYTDVKGFDIDERQQTHSSQVAPAFEAWTGHLNVSKESFDRMSAKERIKNHETHNQEVAGETENQPSELIQKDKFKSVVRSSEMAKDGIELMAHAKVYESEQNGKQPATLLCKEQEKKQRKLNVSGEACEREVNEKKIVGVRDFHQESKKNVCVATSNGNLEACEDISKRAYERVELDSKVEETCFNVVCEPGKSIQEINEQKEPEKEQKQAHEQEKNGIEADEACQWVENENKKYANKRGENLKRVKVAYEHEENGRIQKVIPEPEENERWEEAYDREEDRWGQNAACKGEADQTFQKEAFRYEEHDQIAKKFLEQDENEKQQKESVGGEEENWKKLEELQGGKENEMRPKEVSKQEQFEKQPEEACENGNEKPKGLMEQDENEKQQKEVHKWEEKELKEFQEEDNAKKLKEAHESNEIQRRRNEDGENKEEEKIMKKALEPEKNDTKKQVCDGEDSGEKLKALQDTYACKEEEKNLKISPELCETSGSDQTLKVPNETFVLNEDSILEAKHEFCGQEEENISPKVAQEPCEEKETEVDDVTAQCVLEKNEEPNAAKVEIQSTDNELYVEQGATEEEKVITDSKFGCDCNEKKLQEAKDAKEDDKNIKAKETAFSKEVDNITCEAPQNVRLENGHGGQVEAGRPAHTLDEKRDGANVVNDINKESDLGEVSKVGDRVKEERIERQKEQEIERLRKLEEEREREREREKDRMAIEKVTREARERAFAEARERAERAVVERVTAEARQRALAEARERLEKASVEARLRAERAAVERATAEAQERAMEKAMAAKAGLGAKERMDRSVSEKFSTSSRDSSVKHSSSFSDLRDSQFQSSGSFNGSQRYPDSSSHGGCSVLNGYSECYRRAHRVSFATERSQGVEPESAQRCKARLERHKRTVQRAIFFTTANEFNAPIKDELILFVVPFQANALAEKNTRDLLAQREQAERNRLAENLDADVKRWSSGKEGNLRALLSTLQYILGPESGWQPVPLTEVITAVAVKRAYRKATLCVHPDKLQQRGASIQQKYICEKVFDLLKEAWNKFNSEER